MTPLWQPAPDRVAASRLTAFLTRVARTRGLSFDRYHDLHGWSVADAPAFWSEVWDFCDVRGDRGDRLVRGLDRMPGARFFPDARLSFVENLLRRDDDGPAIVAAREDAGDVMVSWRTLARDVRRAARALRDAGVGPGDRVCAVVGNTPATIIAALGAASIGAVWSSCSPDFGVQGIVDRFGQIEPVVMIAIDSYVYGGRRFDCTAKITALAVALPTVRQIVVVPQAGGAETIGDLRGVVRWGEWLGDEAIEPASFTRFAFDQPLYVLYSSGTTGVPKCIVHGAGGTLLQHLKEHQLHCDVQPGDRVFYFTTCGWMMWNWLVTALASSATIALYDGSPFHPDGRRLFDLADRLQVTLFGTSPKFIDAVSKAGLEPRRTHDLASVRTITSTGSPLSPEAFDFVYRSIKADVHLASISGGTDIVSCFVGGNPNGAVWRGEIQAAALGMAVGVFDEAGRPLDREPGELVCTRPFPSMPLGFWNDPDGSKYHAAYFDRFPGVWCHGDWIRSTEHDGFIIYGRSDATLNPGGVRIGTAEIYRQVEQVPEVLESLTVGQQWDGDERIVLFVRLAPGVSLDDALRDRIVRQIRTNTSPRHIPARIIAVADIPRTRSGKIVELAVRRVIHGQPVPNVEALANPGALDQFRDLPDLQR